MDKHVEIKKGTVLPMIPTRDLVVFPGMSVNFDVGREMTVQSLQNARNDFSGDVFLCAQKDVMIEEPEKKDMFKVGTIANIRQVIKSPGGVCRCMVRGIRKAKLVDMIVHDDCYEAVVKPMPNYSKDKLYEHELDAVEREVRKAFEEYSQLMPKMPKEIYSAVIGAKSAEDLFESVAFNIPLSFNDRQTLLELVYIDDLVDEMICALEGKAHRCCFDGTQAVPDENGQFCFVPVSHKVTLGEIADTLEKISSQPSSLIVPEIPDNSFTKKLYSTYLSYLPKEKVSIPLKMNVDDRGSFTELLKTENAGQFSVNVSKPGITKGQHWHHSKWEFFIVVSGKALIQERRIGSDEIKQPKTCRYRQKSVSLRQKIS